MTNLMNEHIQTKSGKATSAMLPSILVVDDERGARMALEVPLRLSGYDVVAASGGREALALGQQKRFDVVLTDIYMPDILGLEVVREFRRFSPDTKVIAVTAQGSLEIALQAVEAGAFDFIAKPFNIDEVLALVSRAAQPPVEAKVIEPPPDFSSSGLIGHSSQMVRAYKLTAHAARSQTTVLIEGESGTGKELIARAIHRHSVRSNHPFTAVNCSALPETLLEAELFGYTKGSFTGAAADKAGLFESSEGGTLFLDELGTTSSSFQASLLRVLQEKEVRRIGAAVARPVDVRIIGATNRNLEELAERGEFRSDLFYRLSVLVVPLPPLRERGTEDIALLAQHFLKKYGVVNGEPLRIGTDVIELLARYGWPGNVRELENTIEHAVAVCNDGVITLNDLPRRILERASIAQASRPATTPTSLIDDRPALAELERRYIQLILAENGGNKSRAAEILNIDRRTIYRYLEPTIVHAGETVQPNLQDDSE